MGVGVSVAALIALLLIFEIVFRLFFPQPLFATELAPWGFWHEPNASFLHASDPHNEGNLLRGTEYLTHISYNSMGIRGPEYAVPKPAGVKRVVVVGDSFGDAMEVEFQETMGQVLARILASRRDELPVTTTRSSDAVSPGASIGELLWATLRADAQQSGAPLLVASLRITADAQTPRATFFDSVGIAWAPVDLPPADRYQHDGHWNVQGNADAATRVFEKIRSAGLLGVGPGDRVEVVNLSHAAFDTCQYLQVFRALGEQFSPDLVLAVDSGIDTDAATADLCSLGPKGELVLRSRTYGTVERLVRSARTLLRSNSHFLTWVFDNLDRTSLSRGGDRVPVPTQ